MNVLKKLSALILALLLGFGALALAGCDDKDKDGKTTKTTTASDETTKDTTKEVNANWTIDINDTVKVDSQGLPIEYKLQFKATKNNGTAPVGDFKGSGAVDMKADFSKVAGLPESVVKVSGGVNGTFNASNVSFRVDKVYDDPNANNKDGDDIKPVPLGKMRTEDLKDTDFYGQGTIKFSGNGNLDITATGPTAQGHFDKSANGSEALPFTIKITGATATMTISKLGTFKGTVTGDPIK